MISSGFVAMLVIVARGFVGAGANGRQGLAFDDGIFWVWGEANGGGRGEIERNRWGRSILSL